MMETLSESATLARAIDAIKRAVRHPGDISTNAMRDLSEAIDLMSLLRAQAVRGIHANPRDEPANEHIRNALAIIYTSPIRKAGKVTFKEEEVKAIVSRLLQAVRLLEGSNPRGRYSPLRSGRAGRGGRGGRGGLRRGVPAAFVRRGNPVLATLGNPPVKPLKATWGRIEYHRTDDPEGKQIVREHGFDDGFIAEGLEDGSVLLRHPRGLRLWTVR